MLRVHCFPNSFLPTEYTKKRTRECDTINGISKGKNGRGRGKGREMKTSIVQIVKKFLSENGEESCE